MLRLPVVRLIGALAAVAIFATGCSGTDTPSTSTAPSARASVTQTAPSVWSPEQSADSASGGAGSGGDAATTSTAASTLPGLTEACTAAIRAQEKVAGLFAIALAASASSAPTTTTAPPPPSDATTAPTTAPSATQNGGLTASQVAHAFDAIDALPGDLADAFAALHKVANSLIGKSAVEASAAMSKAPYTTAMQSISTYIAQCRPPATS